MDLSRRAKSSNAAALATAIILIYESAEGIFQGKLCEEYTHVLDHVYVYYLGEGYAVDWSYLYQKPPTDRDVVALLNFNKCFLQ